jgi:hypothetical protein
MVDYLSQQVAHYHHHQQLFGLLFDHPILNDYTSIHQHFCLFPLPLPLPLPLPTNSRPTSSLHYCELLLNTPQPPMMDDHVMMMIVMCVYCTTVINVGMCICVNLEPIGWSLH